MQRKGFTLIELLVVVSIIGLLSAIVVIAVSDARARAENTERIAEIQQIKNAIELYRSDNNGNYPIWNTVALSNREASIALPLLVTEGYLPSLPLDEKCATGSPYQYFYCNGSSGGGGRCETDNDQGTYALSFTLDCNGAGSLAPTNRYCATSEGIYPEASESTDADINCEQR